MKRKIIELGKNCLVVSLPAKWAKDLNFKKGDELEVSQEGSRIIFGSMKKVETKKTEVDISSPSFPMNRYLGAIYHAGYDEIKLTFTKPNTIKEIQKIIGEMLGYEIVNQGKNYCIIRSVAGTLEQEFDSMLRRAFFVTKAIAQNSLEAIKKNDFQQLQEATILEKTNNKLTNFCRRVINKKFHYNTTYATELYAFIYQLEKIGDEYKYMCQCISKQRIKVSKKIIELYARVNRLFEKLENSFYNFKEEDIEYIAKERKDIIKKRIDLYKLLDKKELVILDNLTNITQLIFNMIGCKLRLVI